MEPASAPPPGPAPRRLRIGVSACLLGHDVRYDGGHKRDRFLTDVLAPWVEWVPVCPEVEIGLGTPRPPIRLVRLGPAAADPLQEGLRLIAPSTGADHTAAMTAYAARRVAELREAGLAGYVLKKDSPSCGLERVKVYGEGAAARTGRGLFAAALLRGYPELPVEEEGRLNDPALRESFLTHAYAYDRWREGEREGWTRAALLRFHERHKLVLMARNQAGMRRLGRLLGEASRKTSAAALAAAYLPGFTAVMRRPPTRKGHTNVLHHMAGYVSDALDRGDRQELAATIESYRQGLLPLIVPLTLLRHHVRRQGVDSLRDQAYLDPHPGEMMLLHHV